MSVTLDQTIAHKQHTFWSRLFGNQTFWVVLAVVLACLFLTFATDSFATRTNLFNITRNITFTAIIALGMTFVIITGGIDLSVGSTLGLAGVIAGALMHGVTLPMFGVILYPAVWVVAVLACLLGAFVGLINGVLVARFKVPPFVATLGTLYAVRGVALLITNGLTYNNLEGKAALGNTGFDWLGFNSLFGIPVGVIAMIVIAILGSLLLNRTVFGRWLYASGGNERAAELSGVPVKRVQISVYVISGICAAIGGLILTSELTSAGPTAGTTYELTAIATVVIGGAALTGGRGNIRGTLLGAFVIGFLSDGLVIIGVWSYWQMVFPGAVIVFAVLLNSVQYG
ncbi:hypothetical protein COL154_014026, partial [Colletotrichum chrysophilum]